ncbi:MAG: GC-type dockerin domain-anchored protein [Planctomycetota bacterium]
MRSIALLPAVLVAGSASAQFVTPDAYGWSRTDANTTYYEWDDFVQTCGSPPDVANSPALVGEVGAFLCELGGNGAFITSTLNIYSFSSTTEFEVEIPVDGQEGDTVDVLVQIRTLGSELNYPLVLVDDTAAVETIELSRQTLGGQFGGQGVETLFSFEGLAYQNPILLTFESEFSSMSLEAISIDTVARGTVCVADVNGDGELSPADFNAWILAFNTQGSGCDQNGNGVCEPGDFNAWILNFNAGC